MLKTRIGKLESIAFLIGFALMSYELVAARILAPTIGSSTYVWTSIIGVIIAALSVGYYLGGKIADARNSTLDVALLCFMAAGAALLTLLLYESVLALIVLTLSDPRVQGVVAALVLFAPASFALGMVSPYLAKLNVRSLTTSGRSVASLSALNSVGGIAGTFVTGFILFGYIGSVETLKVVVVLLLFASWLVVPRRRMAERIVASVVFVGILCMPQPSIANAVQIDTPSAHYQVISAVAANERQITGLVTGPGGTQSAVYTDGSSELVFWYNRMFANVILQQQPKRILVLGGGAFTLPQYLAEKLPGSQIDVVEIDPALEGISQQYFAYKNPTNVQLIFNDARTFLNQTDDTYDTVVVDTYGDAEMPFSLTTAQYVQQLARHVTPKGIVLVNAIGGTSTGPCRDVLAALNTSYKQQFAHAVYANERNQPMYRANHVIAYSRERLDIVGMQPLNLPAAKLLTDNYAPTERLYFDCQNA